MELDVVLPPGGPRDAGREAERAERAGFDAVWASEVRHDPFLTLTLAAAATERVGLGTAIAVAFARNPMSTAVLANDLQALSGGRFVLGLGTQVRAHVTRRFSMPWSRPAARMREYVLALREIWACWHEDRPLEFVGEFSSHTLMTPMFVPEPHPHGSPPVLLAGVGESMTEVAGEVADGFLCHGFTTERYLREVTLPALRRGRARAGATLPEPAVVGAPMVVTGRTEEELAAAALRVRAQIAFYASTPAYRPVLELHGWGALGEELHGLSRAGRWGEMTERIDDYVLGEFAILGDPVSAGRELRRRYGDVFTRVSLYQGEDTDPAVLAELATAVRTAEVPA